MHSGIAGGFGVCLFSPPHPWSLWSSRKTPHWSLEEKVMPWHVLWDPHPRVWMNQNLTLPRTGPKSSTRPMIKWLSPAQTLSPPCSPVPMASKRNSRRDWRGSETCRHTHSVRFIDRGANCCRSDCSVFAGWKIHAACWTSWNPVCKHPGYCWRTWNPVHKHLGSCRILCYRIN